MKQLYYYIGLLLMAAIIMALPSCSTTHKNKSVVSSSSEVKIKKDSSAVSVVKSDSVGIKKDNSIRTVVTDGETTTETVIDFDSIPNDYKVTDYFPTDVSNLIWAPIKKITTKTTTKTHIEDTHKANTTDSIHKVNTAQNNVDVRTNEQSATKTTTKLKTVDRTTFNWWLLLWLIPILIAGRVAYNFYHKRPLIS